MTASPLSRSPGFTPIRQHCSWVGAQALGEVLRSPYLLLARTLHRDQQRYLGVQLHFPLLLLLAP